MGPIHLLQEIAVIATVSVIVTVVLSHLRLPTVAGLLLSGALIGPHALELAPDVEAIEVLFRGHDCDILTKTTYLF